MINLECTAGLPKQGKKHEKTSRNKPAFFFLGTLTHTDNLYECSDLNLNPHIVLSGWDWLRMYSLTTASFVALEPCPKRVKRFSTPCQANNRAAICPLVICFPKMKLLMTGEEGEGSSERD